VIAGLLRKVKKKLDSTLQVANHPIVRIMKPGFLPEQEWPDEDAATKRTARPITATWICFPYFSLEEYYGLFSNSKKGAHPMHTLLQTRSSLTTEKRERKQAVCQNDDNPNKLCFHVGQIWCLVLDDCKIVGLSESAYADQSFQHC
jgi:hypothetical protein